MSEQSKFLSLILRHQPEKIGIQLNAEGWVAVPTLLIALAKYNKTISFDELCEIVRTNDKQRFAFNSDKTQIRANQGHSVTINLKLKPQVPPAILYHGTVAKFLDSIYAKGLIKGTRNHVHLSSNLETAIKVGQRRGQPVILEINALELSKTQPFYLSDNNVWLTESVPPAFINRT